MKTIIVSGKPNKRILSLLLPATRDCFQKLPQHLRLRMFHILTYRNYLLLVSALMFDDDDTNSKGTDTFKATKAQNLMTWGTCDTSICASRSFALEKKLVPKIQYFYKIKIILPQYIRKSGFISCFFPLYTSSFGFSVFIF